MRDINGDNNGTIYDKSTTVVINNSGKTYKDTAVEKIKISFKKILIEKVIEAIIGGLLAVIASQLGKYLSSKGTNIQFNIHLILIIIFIICILFSLVLFIAFAIDLLHILQLKRKGKFVEFESKIEIANNIINKIRTDEVVSITRSVGKVYKNIDGNIFQISSKKCPFCKSEPIGNMHLIYDIVNNEYMWVCSEQQSHMISFDYKENF